MTKRILFIGGSDSSDRAGIHADKEIAAQLGMKTCVAITAVTAQTDEKLLHFHTIPKTTLVSQLKCAEEIGFDAIKIGVLPDLAAVKVVKDFLIKHKSLPKVLDPVLSTSSDFELTTDSVINALAKELFPLVDLITPNANEAKKFSLLDCDTIEDAECNAKALLSQGAHAVLLKGGHLSGPKCIDLLTQKSDVVDFYTAEWIPTHTNPRGTGCRLASAIACNLAQGYHLNKAVQKARNLVAGYIKASQSETISDPVPSL